MKRFALIALVLLLTVLPIGCGCRSENGTGDNDGAAATDEAAPEPAENPDELGSIDYRAASKLAEEYLAVKGIDRAKAPIDIASFIKRDGKWFFGYYTEEGESVAVMEISAINGELIGFEEAAADDHLPEPEPRPASAMVAEADEYVKANYGLDITDYFTYVSFINLDETTKIYYDKYAPEVYNGYNSPLFDYFDGVCVTFSYSEGKLISAEEYSHPRDERVKQYLSKAGVSGLADRLCAFAGLEADGEKSFAFADLKAYYEGLDDTEAGEDITFRAIKDEACPETVRIIKSGDCVTVELNYPADERLGSPGFTVTFTTDEGFSQGEKFYEKHDWYGWFIG